MSAADDRKKMEENLREYRANNEHHEMTTKALAEMYMTRYKALQEAGFTECQAFKIILRRGLS